MCLTVWQAIKVVAGKFCLTFVYIHSAVYLLVSDSLEGHYADTLEHERRAIYVIHHSLGSDMQLRTVLSVDGEIFICIPIDTICKRQFLNSVENRNKM